MKKPRGPVPNRIKVFMEANSDVPREMLVCDRCGKWWSKLDALAPYHWEECECERCKSVKE